MKADIQQAGARLKAGKLVALPTETVYGLGANALDGKAVASIYATKGRPSFNPLIVHVASVEKAKEFAVFTPLAAQLAHRFWPGPLTMVLHRVPDCPLSELVSAGLDTVAIRLPAHPVMRDVLETCGLPIAAPSANRSGKISPTTAQHVAEEFTHDDVMIVDGGPCTVGLESTVVDATGDVPVLLRYGSITAEEIAQACGHQPAMPTQTDTPASPGMLLKHYAPTKPLRLDATDAQDGEALLGFGADAPTDVTLNLSPRGDLREAAANLFAYLRKLDSEHDCKAIAAMPIPNEGLGIAINDRLERAARK